MIYSNDIQVHSLCKEYGIKCSILPCDMKEMVSVPVSGTYILVQEGGMFVKINDIKDLQKRLN